MRGHTGALMSLDQGTTAVAGISTTARKDERREFYQMRTGWGWQAIPPDTMFKAIWFVIAQQMNIDGNIFYQDNTSAIHMKNNGKILCTKKLTKHIEIR